MLLEFLITGIAVGCIYALVGLGLSILFASTHIVNMAHGEFVMLGAMIGFTLTVIFGLPALVVFPLVLVVTGLLGVVFRWLVVRPLERRHASVAGIVIATIGVSTFLRNGAPFVWGTVPLAVPSPVGPGAMSLGGANVAQHYVVVIGVTCVLVAAVWFLFERTILGLTLRAVALNRDAAWLMGVNVNRAVQLSLVISAALAGVAGLTVAPITIADTHMGLLMLLKGLTAGIIGGFGNHLGVLLGGLLVGLLEIFVAYYISPGYRDALVYVVMLAVLYVRPHGLFRAPAQAEDRP